MKRIDMTEQNNSGAMTTYRFFAVDHSDAVRSVRWIDCTDDADASEIGRSLLTEISGIEVWDVGRRICKLAAS